AALDTARVLASENCPASSMTSRSRLPADTLEPVMVQAVPPISAPPEPDSTLDRSSLVVPCHGTGFLCLTSLATASGSTPAAMALCSTFSTTAWDCATTPTFQPASTSSRITWEATKVLPVPGGPCTAK